METVQWAFSMIDFNGEAITKDMLAKKYIESMSLTSCLVDLVTFSTSGGLIECEFNVHQL